MNCCVRASNVFMITVTLLLQISLKISLKVSKYEKKERKKEYRLLICEVSWFVYIFHNMHPVNKPLKTEFLQSVY